MDDLIAFLRARFDEDEQSARAAAGAPWTVDDVPGWIHVEANAVANSRHLRGLGYVGSVEREGDRRHIARHDPARVLREVEAKRCILNAYAEALRVLDGFRETGWEEGRREALDLACRALALPYADHHKYREEWKP